jgi:hypothetical protein
VTHRGQLNFKGSLNSDKELEDNVQRPPTGESLVENTMFALPGWGIAGSTTVNLKQYIASA